MGTGPPVDSLLQHSAVHPHGRGDWAFANANVASLNGSPPRAWGLGRLWRQLPHLERFTPTGVGTGSICLVRDSSLSGSPPRAWGLGCPLRDSRPAKRFTPTGVGTGANADAAARLAEVHPHGRGDWSAVSLGTPSRHGSPPRAWGLVLSGFLALEFERFTPTGVGTGQGANKGPAVKAVHPHGRGDWTSNPGRPALFSGSPPRAWGLEGLHESRGVYGRFTPTGVGTGLSKRFFNLRSAVHPHGRGDWAAFMKSQKLAFGSPPRAWGLGHFYLLSFWRNTVHPHGRGDWACKSLTASLFFGSPPRAWGLAAPIANSGLGVRFTPTGVGTGCWARSAVIEPPVHPHGRGDWWLPRLMLWNFSGSPPRAWGLEGKVKSFQTIGRFTPTGVGTGLWRPAPRREPSVHPHGRGDWGALICGSCSPHGSPPRAWGLAY